MVERPVRISFVRLAVCFILTIGQTTITNTQRAIGYTSPQDELLTKHIQERSLSGERPGD